MSEFLPVTHEEMKARGWEQADFVYITGDAYVDHPSFGAAIITRTLEAYGYKVCIISQPNWKEVEEFRRFGKPRLGFLISSGNIGVPVLLTYTFPSILLNSSNADIFSTSAILFSLVNVRSVSPYSILQ